MIKMAIKKKKFLKRLQMFCRYDHSQFLLSNMIALKFKANETFVHVMPLDIALLLPSILSVNIIGLLFELPWYVHTAVSLDGSKNVRQTVNRPEAEICGTRWWPRPIPLCVGLTCENTGGLTSCAAVKFS